MPQGPVHPPLPHPSSRPVRCSRDLVSLAHLMLPRNGRNWPTVEIATERGLDPGLPLPTLPCYPSGIMAGSTFWDISRAGTSAQGDTQ